MLKSKLLLILLFLLCQYVTSFDYYLLALQWPAGVCSQRKCNAPLPRTLTIHGHWPSNWRGPNPKPVPGQQVVKGPKLKLTLTPYSGLVANLARDWPQLYSSGWDNFDFWAHEWKDHGRATPLKIPDYFQKALDAYSSYNPLIHLQAAGFVPDNVKDYNATLFHGAIGGSTLLSCYKDLKANKYILTEIRSCYDNVAVTSRIPCRGSPLGSCGGNNGRIIFKRP